jgi:hypothetical protein
LSVNPGISFAIVDKGIHGAPNVRELLKVIVECVRVDPLLDGRTHDPRPSQGDGDAGPGLAVAGAVYAVSVIALFSIGARLGRKVR